jgi:acyl carrier protein
MNLILNKNIYIMEDLLQIKGEIKQFIQKTSYLSEDQINNETLIFTQGIMDSMGFMLLIGYIDEKFSITAAEDEFVEENFESINAIAGFVVRKLQNSPKQSIQL